MRSLTYLILAAAMLRCSSDTELKKSVFIPDPQSPDLPKYSEWGYNTFGSFYDRDAFVSDDNTVPLKVTTVDGNTSFIFSGHRNSRYDQVSITLVLHKLMPQTYSDLIGLNNTVIDLTLPDYELLITENGTTYQTKIISGSFQFKRAQNLLVDENPEEVILSGTFEFQTILNQVPVSFTDGRFDVGVGNSNFYKY